MLGFGDELRTERELRGVSLEALSEETKINLRHFKALEEGQYHHLPSGVFRRGIVRAYLKALSLDETDWLPRFDASFEESARRLGLKTVAAEEDWVAFASNVKKSRIRKPERTGWRWAGVALLFLGLLAACWALWVLQLRVLVQGG